MTKQFRDNRVIRIVTEGLKVLREERGLPQTDVVRETGLNVGRVEAAMTNISITTIEKLCSYYGITLDKFFNRIGL